MADSGLLEILSQARDQVDIEKTVRYIEPLESFRQDSQLLNVVTGVSASSSKKKSFTS